MGLEGKVVGQPVPVERVVVVLAHIWQVHAAEELDVGLGLKSECTDEHQLGVAPVVEGVPGVKERASDAEKR